MWSEMLTKTVEKSTKLLLEKNAKNAKYKNKKQ